jgi:hypothetical protein
MYFTVTVIAGQVKSFSARRRSYFSRSLDNRDALRLSGIVWKVTLWWHVEEILFRGVCYQQAYIMTIGVVDDDGGC